MGKLKLLSLFSGIGAFEKALENIGEPFEVVRYCEIDKYASKAYSLIHNLDENMNLKDIKDVDTHELPDDIDLVTYGFPCQDISNAGKQKGFVYDGELTRSGLFFEALRIIEDAQPKIAICENVKALTSKKFKTEFKIVLDSLNDAGYKNYWAVLNAKDYGIPQNRERVFIISIRDDIDHGFEFPEKYELKLRLKDLLEDNVDEKFYLNEEQVKRLTGNVFNSANKRVQEKDYSDTLLARDDGISNTLATVLKDSYVVEQQKRFFKQAFETLSENECEYGDTINAFNKTVNKSGISPTLTTRPDGFKTAILQVTNDLRIRKLTPKECFRLMGFDDSDVDILIDNGISNTQLYKMAGNSIVVDVLEEIFVELLNQYEDVFPYIG